MGYSRFLLHHGKIVGARLSRTGCAQTRGAPCRGSLLPGYHPGAALFTVDRRLLRNPEQGAQCARCRQNRRHRKKLSAITLAIRPPPPGPKGASRWASTQKTPRSKGGEKGGKTAREARQAVNSAAASPRLAGGLLASRRLPTTACLDCRIPKNIATVPGSGRSVLLLTVSAVSYCIG